MNPYEAYGSPPEDRVSTKYRDDDSHDRSERTERADRNERNDVYRRRSPG